MKEFVPNKAGLVSVKLMKNYASNVAGETAGFLPEIAEALVKSGIAHLPGQPPKTDEAEKPKRGKKAEEPKTDEAENGEDAPEVTTRKFLKPRKTNG